MPDPEHEEEPAAIRVVIVDDHALFRRRPDLVLSEEPGIEIVGEADGVEAIAQADELDPDVMLMDVRMPKASGIKAARARRAQPHLAVDGVETPR